MAVTEQQVEQAHRLHHHSCTLTVTATGLLHAHHVEVRATGRMDVPKTERGRANRKARGRAVWSRPFMYGMYRHQRVDEHNADEFFVPDECPVTLLVAQLEPLAPEDRRYAAALAVDRGNDDVIVAGAHPRTVAKLFIESIEKEINHERG